VCARAIRRSRCWHFNQTAAAARVYFQFMLIFRSTIFFLSLTGCVKTAMAKDFLINTLSTLGARTVRARQKQFEPNGKLRWSVSARVHDLSVQRVPAPSQRMGKSKLLVQPTFSEPLTEIIQRKLTWL
jgi:hypothetical protein